MFGLSGTSVTSRREIEDERRERKAKRQQRQKEKAAKGTPRASQAKDQDGDKPSSYRRVSSSSASKDKARTRDKSPRRERRPPSLPSSDTSERRDMSLVPEMERRPSGSLASSGGTYPKFSSKHSKEAVGSREDIVNPRLSLYTPDPTDLGSDHRIKTSPERRYASGGAGFAPPSPPLTTTEPDLRRTRSSNSVKKTPSHIRIVSPPRKVSLERGIHEKNGARRTGSSSSLRRRADSEGGRTGSPSLRKVVSRNRSREELTETGTDVSSPSTSQPARDPALQSTAARSDATSTVTESTVEPSPRKTSARAPPPAAVAVSDVQTSPLSAPDSSPRTPTTHDPQFFPASHTVGKPQVIEVVTNQSLHSPYSVQSSSLPTGGSAGFAPPPPPPPPPLLNTNIEIPRVDYLLQNGGLPHLIPKRFTSVLAPTASQQTQYPTFMSPRAFGPQHTDVRNIFAPLQTVLDSYLQVMNKSGSLAVATGYRSVARRLLDRLEAVFNRNISSETCECIMCGTDGNVSMVSEDEGTGISWGEILEFVSGRRDLPAWPPFSISSDAPIHAMNAEAPMQKVDIDVPPEFRDHYIKQSKRTKDAVQNWLAAQPEEPSSPPQEVDDETLLFAIVTHLEPENRKLFTALLRGMSTLPASRAATPAERPKSELMTQTAHALQRLYRLEKPPRESECAIYLLRNPDLHSVLATLAAISSGEWDILISGRFDGFLWSGAEGFESRGPSRGPTPHQRVPSRGPTPSQAPSRGPMREATATSPSSAFGAPVQMDEDTEVAVLGEVEREIFMGMDALEDAFEALHTKAEEVRAALRGRHAGLNVAASRRRGSLTQGPEAIIGTPAIGAGMWGSGGPDEDDWNDDARSELRPDDSASNISYNRRRRKHHREKDRRETPAPVEEEDEEAEVVQPQSRSKRR